MDWTIPRIRPNDYSYLIRLRDLDVWKKWAINISGLENLEIEARKFSKKDENTHMWVRCGSKKIFVNENIIGNQAFRLPDLRAFLLHELGHLIGKNRLNSEYVAHKWAIKKAKQLGLLMELRKLQVLALGWNGGPDMEIEYRVAEKKLLKQGLL